LHDGNLYFRSAPLDEFGFLDDNDPVVIQDYLPPDSKRYRSHPYPATRDDTKGDPPPDSPPHSTPNATTGASDDTTLTHRNVAEAENENATDEACEQRKRLATIYWGHL